ncbi:MAG: hypothetical protein FWD13_04445 [Treponema sp.]|nr:hypothetical protein [Treponema sp.]
MQNIISFFKTGACYSVTVLYKKYVRLVLFNGKHKNVAVTAAARELTRFIWAIQVSNVA